MASFEQIVTNDQIHNLASTDNGHGRKLVSISPADMDFYQRGIRQLQSIDACEFTPDTDGLNLERVESFIAGLGLVSKPIMPVNESAKQSVLDRVGITGPDNSGGQYFPLHDMGFMFRSREREKLNSPAITEAIIVHEKVHGSGRYPHVIQVLTLSPPIVFVPRNGQSLMTGPGDNTIGLFLEEAFAGYIQTKYTTEVLGLPQGFSGRTGATIIETDSEDGSETPIPSKYFSIFEGGEMGLTLSDKAGAAMDYLIQFDPYLFPALIEARSCVAGLRKVAQRLNLVRPGYYAHLRDDFNAYELFEDGLSDVVKELNVT